MAGPGDVGVSPDFQEDLVVKSATVGIIGGTGLGDALVNEVGGEAVKIDTPFGPPSCDPVLATWGGVDVAFVSRHGPGHLLSPSQVPYRANIWALKKVGVRSILASGATGSLTEEIHPGQLVLCDQVIDKTHGRANTFFDEGLAAHVEFAEPFCPRLRNLLVEAGERIGATVHPAGTYVCMEGPQFSTRAESHVHRQWGAHVVGMTCLPEAKLAREAEICYALVALPTDYDCWRAKSNEGNSHALLRQILGNLQRATHNAVTLIETALDLMRGRTDTCHCQSALELAVWSDKKLIDSSVRERLDLLIGRHFDDS